MLLVIEGSHMENDWSEEKKQNGIKQWDEEIHKESRTKEFTIFSELKL